MVDGWLCGYWKRIQNADLELKTGAGFGVRWQSPIGPIRLDLGFPINDDDARQSYRVHFTLGPDL